MPNYLDLTPNEFKQKIQQNSNAKIIDCRTEPELVEYKLDFHLHIDIMKSDFANKLTNLDKNIEYYIYCRSGSRSAFLCDFMFKLGFKSLYNLQGGVIAWREIFN